MGWRTFFRSVAGIRARAAKLRGLRRGVQALVVYGLVAFTGVSAGILWLQPGVRGRAGAFHVPAHCRAERVIAGERKEVLLFHEECDIRLPYGDYETPFFPFPSLVR